MERFEAQKANAMEKFNDALNSGRVDEGILPLLEFINSLQDFYSTSSCSGRITLLHDVGRKPDNEWLGKWHREVSTGEVLKAMEEPPGKGVVLFKYESAILHLVARELNDAEKILVIARDSGYKRVGIQGLSEGRYLVEICDTEKIDAPVIDSGRVLVDEKYLEYLVKLANKKFGKGMRKLERLEKNLRGNLS